MSEARGKPSIRARPLTDLVRVFITLTCSICRRCQRLIWKPWLSMRAYPGTIFSALLQPSWRTFPIYSATSVLPHSPRVGACIPSNWLMKWGFTRIRIRDLVSWQWNSGEPRDWLWIPASTASAGVARRLSPIWSTTRPMQSMTASKPLNAT